MTKLITMKFTVTIKDEDVPNIVPDEDVKRELVEAYNDLIRVSGCSDIRVEIDTIE